MNKRGITVGSLLRWTLAWPGVCDIYCYLGRQDVDEMEMCPGEDCAGSDVVVSVERGVIYGVNIDEQYNDSPYLWQLLWLAPDDVASCTRGNDDRP